jgi:hypothetical protein
VANRAKSKAKRQKNSKIEIQTIVMAIDPDSRWDFNEVSEREIKRSKSLSMVRKKRV